MELVVDKLIDFSGGKDEELRDISGLGASYSISKAPHRSNMGVCIM
jgi:cullin-associated NEDD8-dissociated protein 1